VFFCVNSRAGALNPYALFFSILYTIATGAHGGSINSHRWLNVINGHADTTHKS